MATQETVEEATNQISELEKAFKDCITNLTSQDYFTPNETEETRQSVEHTIQHFLDTARRTEAFFLSQRLQLSVQKPEQMLKEDIDELRLELDRKEKLVEKHHERLQSWINLHHRTNVVPLPPSGVSGSHPSSGPVHSSQGYPGPPPPPGSMVHTQVGHYPGPPLHGQAYNMPPPHPPPPSYSQNPLTFLEQNLSNIGLPERR